MPPEITYRHARDVTELEHRRAAAFVGFAAAIGLLTLIVAAYLNDYPAPIRWRGGEYAYTFLGTTLGLGALGGVIKAAAPGPWRSIGSGMLVASAAGLAFVMVIVGLFMWGLSQWTT
jgi:hypothetical protein